jgi:hypothetical protein
VLKSVYIKRAVVLQTRNSLLRAGFASYVPCTEDQSMVYLLDNKKATKT